MGNEILGLMASLFVPLLALLGSARGELQKDFTTGAIAVFMLGFGADTIKSVLAQRPNQ